MASTYLQRSTGTPTSQTKFTVSAWVKRSGLNPSGNNMDIFCIYSDSSNRMHIRFQEDDIDVINYGGSTQARLTTDRKFRDTNAWYHIVWRVDTTLSTADDRVRLYINGVQETSFSVRTNPSQNFSFGTNWSTTRIGTDNSTSYFDGLMSHFHYSDGYSYGPDTFGSTDSTTGEWKINTSPTFTLGNNGFTVLKDGNTITDQSSNSNDFSVANGTLTKTEDCPSNVFCTMNPLSSISSITFTNGNTGIDYSSATEMAKGTLHFSSGKFYWEAKLTVDTNYPMIGIGSYDDYRMQSPVATGYPGAHTNSYGAYGNGNVYANGSNTGSQSFTWATNDIIGIAVDLDSGTKTIKWFKNGSQIATYNITAIAPFSPYDYNGGEAGAGVLYNFGNGYFGTTAVASAGTNASGVGIFEYNVPAGYTALSTKGLNL